MLNAEETFRDKDVREYLSALGPSFAFSFLILLPFISQNPS